MSKNAKSATSSQRFFDIFSNFGDKMGFFLGLIARQKEFEWFKFSKQTYIRIKARRHIVRGEKEA